MLDDERTDDLRPQVSLTAYGNQGSAVLQAGRDIHFYERKTLRAVAVPAEDVSAVRDAWVEMSAADSAVNTLRDTGLAVIAGRPGMGRYACALRALDQVSEERVRAGHSRLVLQNVIPDWDEPDVSLLASRPEYGYVLDIAQSIDQWENRSEQASAFVSFADTLKSRGSYLVLISSDHGWPTESGAQMRVHVRVNRKPSPRIIAIRHLEEVYGKPDRARWLDLPSEASREETGDAGLGILAGLITDDTSPAVAASLAARLNAITDDQKSREAVAQEFQAWSTHLKDIFGSDSGEGAANRRARLIASSLLDGEYATKVHRTARGFLGDEGKSDAKTILESPDLKDQFKEIGVEVKEHRVRLDAKPGLARATLHHVWEQQPDIHDLLLNLIKDITRPGEIGAGHLEHISGLLVDLALHENDISLFDVAAEWVDDPARHDLVTRMLRDAAFSEALGTQTHRLLLDWAKKPDHRSTVAALVCGKEYGTRLPRKAMVRLRWVLEYAQLEDSVAAAQEAIRRLASRTETLPVVWQSIVGWLAKQETTVGAARAFLAMVDPGLDASALKDILVAGERETSIKDDLSRGWRVVLSQPEVNREAGAVLQRWMRTLVRDRSLPAYAHELLGSTLRLHLAADPVSALIYGIPGEPADAEIIEYRRSFVRRYLPNADL
jgi:hypothetical protein